MGRWWLGPAAAQMCFTGLHGNTQPGCTGAAPADAAEPGVRRALAVARDAERMEEIMNYLWLKCSCSSFSPLSQGVTSTPGRAPLLGALS